MNDQLKHTVCHIYYRQSDRQKADGFYESPSTTYSLVWETAINSGFDCSLGQVVEENSSKFRDRFYSKMEQIGRSEIKGEILSEYFKFSTMENFWPISDFCEMNNMIKMPELEAAIKAMALMEFLKNHEKIEKIQFFQFPPALEAAIRTSLPKGIEVSSDFNGSLVASFSKRLSFLCSLIYGFIKRVISDSYVSISARKQNQHSQFCNAKDLVFDYASPILADQLGRPRFQSKYWGRVAEFFIRSDRETLFLHIYNRSDGIGSPRTYAEKVAKLSQRDIRNKHFVLQSLGSPTLLTATFIDSVRVLIKYLVNRKAIYKAMGDVAPILLPCTDRAFCGGAVFHNIYLHNLLAAAACRINNLERIFAISECQSWEISLGTLVGNRKNDPEFYLVPHVPSKFWDLRSWYFPRTQHNIRICVSSETAYKAYQEAGFDARRLCRVESSRFDWDSKGALERRGKLSLSREPTIKIAYFADYSSEITARHVELLREALQKIDVNFELFIKKHPDTDADFSSLDFCKPRSVGEDAYSIIEGSNIVVAGARSSISVQAWEMGAHLLLIYDRTRLNTSAMREQDDIIFCGDGNELREGILCYVDVESSVRASRDFFISDPAFRRWGNLIGAFEERQRENS